MEETGQKGLQKEEVEVRDVAVDMGVLLRWQGAQTRLEAQGEFRQGNEGEARQASGHFAL